MEIDFGGTAEDSDNVLAEFQMDESAEHGLSQGIDVHVWVPNVDSIHDRQCHAKQEALEMLRRAVSALEADLAR